MKKLEHTQRKIVIIMKGLENGIEDKSHKFRKSEGSWMPSLFVNFFSFEEAQVYQKRFIIKGLSKFKSVYKSTRIFEPNSKYWKDSL